MNLKYTQQNKIVVLANNLVTVVA